MIGKCINAEEVQVWKDVDGIYTCDPKIIKESKLIYKINYKDASEMAKYGAKILHPIALKPCQEKNIPVKVKNSYNTKSTGTIISNIHNNKFIGLTYKKNIAIVKIYENDLDTLLKCKNIDDIDVISIKDSELCISINDNEIYKLNFLDNKNRIKIKTNLTSLTIINSNMKKKKISDYKVKEYLKTHNINIYLMNDKTLILEPKYLFVTLKLLHKLLIR